MVKGICDGVCWGEWRTPLATHEYQVMFFAFDRASDGIEAGRWAFVEVIEYGEWITLFSADAREYMPAYVVEEIEAAIAAHIKDMEARS